MATQDDVRRIALSLPEAREEPGFVFLVAGKGFAWPWRERVDPKTARVPNLDVLAVRVTNELEKQALLALDTDVFFTDRTTTAIPPCWCGSRPSSRTYSRRSSPTPGSAALHESGRRA
jgi:hypothetical protein